MLDAAAIVLAGGRSSRMGSPKAALEWHGSTLLRRVTGIVARSLSGPVVVVSAPGQTLPPLDRAVEVVADEREGRGPLQGLAAGLAAVGARAAAAYVSSTDVPLLHPAFVRRIVGELGDEVDVVLPEIGGYRQPLAAAYRLDLLSIVEELIATDRMRPAFLFERCRVLHLSDEAILRDPAVARVDPELDFGEQPERAARTTSALSDSRRPRYASGDSGRSRRDRTLACKPSEPGAWAGPRRRSG